MNPPNVALKKLGPRPFFLGGLRLGLRILLGLGIKGNGNGPPPRILGGDLGGDCGGRNSFNLLLMGC